MSELTIEKILPNGDCALMIRLVDSTHRLSGIHALAAELLSQPIEVKNNSIINIIPAVDSLVLVFIQPVELSIQLRHDIEYRINNLSQVSKSCLNHEISVCYDSAVAPDLDSVCKALGLSTAQLIEHHTSLSYRVDMLGFLPGFAYLSATHEALNLPRKETPSLQVPAGSVAIAGHQTGLYSLPSPGGWHVIGRTPQKMIDWHNEQQPMRLNPLDKVTFKAIDLAQFKAMESADDR